MTHEFKTPLSSILLASSFLNKQDLIKKDKKLEKYTEIIINQSKKLNSHIEQILTLAKTCLESEEQKNKKTGMNILGWLLREEKFSKNTERINQIIKKVL
jgi:two-component system phosphate regulon sensor histidine kinase PhoR